MSLRGAFAANLARLCDAEESIAKICRSTSINRQQFNHYLAGDTVPSQRVLRKLAGYFRVDEVDFFRSGSVPRRPKSVDEEWSSHPDARAALKLIHSSTPSSIAPGIYFAHFAIPQDPQSVMRSTVVIRRDGALLTFRRLTAMSEPKGSWWSNYYGDHKGVVLERAHWIYFIGLNAEGNHEPSMLVVRWLSSSTPMLGGQAQVMNPIGPIVTAVVLNPCKPGTSVRSALRRSRVYSIDDPKVDTIVVDALEEQCQALIAKIRKLDLSVTRLGASSS